MRILFISRKYPPIIGGMENYAYYLHKEFVKHHDVHDIILCKKQWHLVWFYPWIFISGLFYLTFKKIDLVYVGDGVLCSVAWFFQSVMRKKVILTIHGLDVIYQQSFYQKMVGLFLPKIKIIVANSYATKEAAVKRKVREAQITVIPVGVHWSDNTAEISASKEKLSEELGINVDNKVILFTIGRLVERKGVCWFVKHVMPKLSEEFIYIIAGSGPDEQRIKSVVREYNLSDSVFIRGKVAESKKHELFSCGHVFISPNIKKEGDMEGFGIVNLEAGCYGMPVVATKVDGVQDAVTEGVTGYLVPEKDIESFIAAIKGCLKFEKLNIERYTKENYSWDKIYHHYMRLVLD